VAIRAPVVELHTGAWCNAAALGEGEKAKAEFARLRAAASEAARLGLECHAGHGLDFDTARLIAALPEMAELNIGHFLIGEAIFIGLDASVRRMIAAIDQGRTAGAAA
jgi:pyridoxine 5-phosphate synthase